MLHKLSLKQLHDGLKNKDFTSKELTGHYLDRIAKHDVNLNSFISVTSEHALAQAQEADKIIQRGEQTGMLTGIPIAQKDIFCTKGIKTTCCSKILAEFTPPYDATVIKKYQENNSIMIGKTNMDEFAMGGSNENSYFGLCANPWDLTRVPGGSSGGSASAVAARLCPGATGTDTGGSIRQPASFCGISGIKPTYGRISRYGMIAFASSLDQAGPMAPSAEDLAIMLQAMAGKDSQDMTSANIEVPNYLSYINESLKGKKVGLPKEFFQDGLDDKIRSKIEDAIEVLKQQGVEFVEISLPNSVLAVPTYYIIGPCEASSNLARYDGVRYGYRTNNPKNLESLYKDSRAEGFGDEVKRRILIGTYALSSGYYDAYYQKAQKIRKVIKEDFDKAFEKVDLILGPTTPSFAYKIGAMTKDPVKMYLGDIFTIPANLAGLPGMSIPVGFSNNMPIGMQLIGKAFAEPEMLNMAHIYQQNTDWHTQIPEKYTT
ncbi:MAG: Asp-tRNA(Asn)/Glu-tRNA(Gln) amidotransferase subunit GatA [Legionellales bacterium]|jgi:aspartyl-tRNA(Asn)/glutamyl-tRNA(Gln) amidotransferase subunit A|nr:Asp-tRNA(Asn)/Glu-tRNA(Gln) amidotransferase subunit GatA [Legionellales bacterium]